LESRVYWLADGGQEEAAPSHVHGGRDDTADSEYGGQVQMGVSLLAGSNVRISELLALRIERHISDDRTTLYIRQQRKKDGSGVTDVLKTPAACRDIDLHSSLAKMLDDFIGDRKSGFLIQTENGTMLSPENFFRDGLQSVLKRMGRAGVRFHAFRRFREAMLQKSEARQLLIDYWMGHENDLQLNLS
jgi:integrase